MVEANSNHERAVDLSLRGAIRDVFGKMERSAVTEEPLSLSSGFADLDAITGGLFPGEMSVLAGRTGIGKTAFALSLAVKVASQRTAPSGSEMGGLGVVYISPDASREHLALRLVAAEAAVSVAAVRAGRLSSTDWDALTDAAVFLSSLPLTIDDAPSLAMPELVQRVARAKEEFGEKGTSLGLVVVDCLQSLGSPPPGVAANREQEVSWNSRSLKRMARELEVHVLVVSQLNRVVEARGDRRPSLADLRESGAIEQNADVVTFIHREGHDNVDCAWPDLAEFIVAKQRLGPREVCFARWHGPTASFGKLSPGEVADACAIVGTAARYPRGGAGQW